MTRAAILQPAHVTSKHQLTEYEICRVLRDAIAAQRAGQPIMRATVERVVQIDFAARMRAASQEGSMGTVLVPSPH
jgi:hypothetical protein